MFVCSALNVTSNVAVQLLCESTDLLCVSEGELFGEAAVLPEFKPFFVSDVFSA